MHIYRTHTCSEITKKNSGKTVKLSGWIHRKRDHGNLLFFDLRDHFGLTQCVIENSNSFFKTVEKIKPESVVCVTGKVVDGSAGTVNKDLFTGMFWSGQEALELGLIDGIGQVNSILKDRFGNNVKIKEFQNKKRFFDLGNLISITFEVISNKIEEKLIFKKFGL